ncbi:hypothetical protein ANN_10867 [Periplaneta americana]|uniref:Uncharacterized protein n=1 Tax=Periplaneta americana TaxID=6978 RepID=A0ABQ8T4Z6_PERAM|nr:hypothetical protein ANN_10867 [Periplaneta americana]
MAGLCEGGNEPSGSLKAICQASVNETRTCGMTFLPLRGKCTISVGVMETGLLESPRTSRSPAGRRAEVPLIVAVALELPPNPLARPTQLQTHPGLSPPPPPPLPPPPPPPPPPLQWIQGLLVKFELNLIDNI